MDMLKKAAAVGSIVVLTLYPAGSAVVYLDNGRAGLTAAPIADVKFMASAKSESGFATLGGRVEITVLTSGHAEFLKT
ncbi:MAG: hypothetical protein V3V55_08320 [Rhodospirillales bacterium]